MSRTAVIVLFVLSLAAPLESLRGQGRPDPLLAALDTDGNGRLSKAEITAASASLAKLDTDGNGEIAAEELRRGARPSQRQRGAAPASLEKAPLALDDDERKALAVLAELDGQRRGNMNVPENDGRLLRMLAESTNARHVVELGTSNGYSGIWIALGLRATGGKLVTYDIDPRRVELARGNFDRAGVAERIEIVLGDAHETVQAIEEPIDILFIDADKDGYIDYLEKLLPKVRPGGLVLSHNMNRPRPSPEYVEAITTDPRLDTLFFHMDSSGIAVSLKKAPAGTR